MDTCISLSMYTCGCIFINECVCVRACVCVQRFVDEAVPVIMAAAPSLSAFAQNKRKNQRKEKKIHFCCQKYKILFFRHLLKYQIS
jgi:hypothetical protein